MTTVKSAVKTDVLQHQEMKTIVGRAHQYLKAGYPVHFTGPTGVGKTTLALAVAKKMKRPVMLMHGHQDLSNEDLIGAFSGYSSSKEVDNYIRRVYRHEEQVTENWSNGRLLEAVENGYTLVYDEFTRSLPSANNLFLSILEEGILPLYGRKEKRPFVRVHPRFSVIFTSNPEEYAGVHETQSALLDRLITLPIGYADEETEAAIVSSKTGVTEDQAKDISAIVAPLRKACKKNNTQAPSLRATMMIATIVYEEEIEVVGDNDEFQQLCIDILAPSVMKCLEKEDFEKATEMVVAECKKKEKG